MPWPGAGRLSKGERQHKNEGWLWTSSRGAVAQRRWLPKMEDATKWEVCRIWHHDSTKAPKLYDPTKALRPTTRPKPCGLRLDHSVEAEF